MNIEYPLTIAPRGNRVIKLLPGGATIDEYVPLEETKQVSEKMWDAQRDGRLRDWALAPFLTVGP